MADYDYDDCRHNQFVTIIPMTQDEYDNGGEKLEITYSFSESPFGEVIIASTPKGICEMSFVDERKIALADIQSRYPKAFYKEETIEWHKDAMTFFDIVSDDPTPVTLHMKGTEFQFQVWNMLLKIPVGTVTSYSSIAKALKNPNGARAVGGAVGKNVVAYIIPCHRVITSTDSFGGYRWGVERKIIMITHEGAFVTGEESN